MKTTKQALVNARGDSYVTPQLPCISDTIPASLSINENHIPFYLFPEIAG